MVHYDPFRCEKRSLLAKGQAVKLKAKLKKSMICAIKQFRRKYVSKRGSVNSGNHTNLAGHCQVSG